MHDHEQQLVAAFERELVLAGIIPADRDLSATRLGKYLEYLGGAAIGFLIANVAALFNFIVFNFFLHVGA
ncbi:MAG: hypothetical protein ACYDC8_10515 [Gammaproteobacteria bacterium]